MENASKALIIAGAILLSIVLITLGVLIIGRGQDAIEQTNIDDQVVATWNQKWTKYEGTGVSGTTVNNMINEVISSNKVVTNNGEIEKVIGITSPKVTVSGTLQYEDANGNKKTGGAETCSQYAKPNAKYNVTTTRNKSGYIFKIDIQ